MEHCQELCFELFSARLAGLLERFAFQGPGREEFLLTLAENAAAWSPEARAEQRRLLALWQHLNRALGGPDAVASTY